MIKLKDILQEWINELNVPTSKKSRKLNEVGDSREGYPLSVRYTKGGVGDEPLHAKGQAAYYNFTDEDGINFKITLEFDKDRYLDVTFGLDTETDWPYIETNKGKQFKIMATVISAIEEELKLDAETNNIKGIKYVAANKQRDWDRQKDLGPGRKLNEPMNARDRLYTAFIKNRIPGAQIEYDRYDGTKATFKNPFSTNSTVDIEDDNDGYVSEKYN